MSESIPAEIWIGGRIPSEHVSELCEVIGVQEVSLEWGEARFEPETADDLVAICKVRNGVRLLFLCDDQANSGEFADLEEFLIGTGISFRRRSESKAEFDGELVEYRPGIGPVRTPCDGGGCPFVPLPTMISVAEAVDQAANTAEGQTALELLRRLRNLQHLVHESMPVVVPPLEPFEIVD
jgi:hypothetical protein